MQATPCLTCSPGLGLCRAEQKHHEGSFIDLQEDNNHKARTSIARIVKPQLHLHGQAARGLKDLRFENVTRHFHILAWAASTRQVRSSSHRPRQAGYRAINILQHPLLVRAHAQTTDASYLICSVGTRNTRARDPGPAGSRERCRGPTTRLVLHTPARPSGIKYIILASRAQADDDGGIQALQIETIYRLCTQAAASQNAVQGAFLEEAGPWKTRPTADLMLPPSFLHRSTPAMRVL